MVYEFHAGSPFPGADRPWRVVDAGAIIEQVTRPILRTTAGGRTMHELTITPEGHLLVRETSLATPDRKPSKRLLEAYGESPARGMLLSATEEMDAALPPPFEFARSIALLYLTNLCHAAIAEP